ncbi:hypothetical protein POM88_042826 [Heracleum sosnowskyi]|uniref:Uncharacterized protein n=1 Tax=Heracleum sosnowskyi TaxID=360622 RepID=A0AAD8HH74_9APIA|nr:hypothetical protein POM88_042826 [Heracleum sosnowskyi]
MDEEQPGSNNPQYESLSDDEADLRENETDTATGPPTVGSVKPEKEGKGIKRKWSKAWDTFDHIKGTPEEGDTAKCKKSSYTIAYNSSFGTGNMLKHQKICVSSADIRQMIISKSQGTMMVHHGAFDPKVFRDMITDAVGLFDLYKDRIPTYNVVFEGLPGSSIEHQGLDVMKEFDALDNEVNSTAEKNELDSCLAHNIVESLICTRDWKFNEQVHHNYTLEELTQDITRLDIIAPRPGLVLDSLSLISIGVLVGK